MSEPIIRIADIAWIRLRSPDLDRQEQFLTDFGMARTERSPTSLYMRGTDPDHHIHITEKGDPAVLAIAFWARSEDDLHKISKEASGASGVEHLDEPGGGKRVRLTEHNGLGIEVVHGVATGDTLPVNVMKMFNTGHAKHSRKGELQRIDVRPSQVKRIGHCVISTPDIAASAAWARHHLGIVPTDEVHAEDDKAKLLASFNRIDAGDEFVDHHVVMFGLHDRGGLNHVAFEVQDFDDLQVGHENLKQRHHENHIWGVGRHLLGSQIFDYWKDPWGRVHEHWTDSDVVNDKHEYRLVPRSQGLRSQWGPNATPAFRDSSTR